MVRFCSKQVIAKRTAWALVFFSAYSAVFSDPEHLKRAVVVFFVGFSPSHHILSKKEGVFKFLDYASLFKLSSKRRKRKARRSIIRIPIPKARERI